MSDDRGDRAPAANWRIHAPEGWRNDVYEIFIHQTILFENLKELVLDIQWLSLWHVIQPPYLGQYSDSDSLPKRTPPLVLLVCRALSCGIITARFCEMKSVSPSVPLAKPPGAQCSRYKKELSCLKHFSLSRS